MTVKRREFLAGIGALAALRVSAEAPAALDLDDPATNLQAFVKLLGSLDGEPIFDMVHGSVYGLMAGRPAQPLFRTIGAGVATFEQRSSLEYLSRSRYVGLVLDWHTGEPVERWTNPYTDHPCPVPVTSYGPGEVRILTDRMLPTGDDTAAPATGIRPWFRLGQRVHIQREVLAGAPERPHFPKADLMTYSGDGNLLADPAVLRMPSQLNFAAVETWREWMGMEEQPAGTLWWHVSGAKLGSADE